MGPVLPGALGTAHPRGQHGLHSSGVAEPQSPARPARPGAGHTEEGVAGPGLSEVRDAETSRCRREEGSRPLGPVCSL